MGRIKINTKTKKAVKESYIDDLGYDIDSELDSEEDIFDTINSNSDKFYEKPDYLDEYDDVIEDEPFEQEDEEQSENIKNDSTDTYITDTVVTALRDELKKKEYQRDYLKFRYRGEVCDGVPMLEINPSKFVFKIDDKLVGVKLGEIKIL